MKSRPVLMSAPMVRAILDGSKTQTRRICKVRKHPDAGCEIAASELVREPQHVLDRICPYGQPGDRLWVRETFCPIYPQDPAYNGGQPIEYDYAATYQHGDRLGDSLGIKKVWNPSIHMPRAASRILLEVTGVRVEHLQHISPEDAMAEGAEALPLPDATAAELALIDWPLKSAEPYRNGFALLWESINGAGSWDANPWVWVVEFKRVA